MIKIGQLIQQRYRLIKLLGSGGFGAVYLAEDLRLTRLVAIKEMSPTQGDKDAQSIALKLFEREAMMLAQLSHSSLTRVWDYFEEDDHVFLVMEYVQGLSLRDLLRQYNTALPELFVLNSAIELCSVLSYLHKKEPPIVFRDLKPANIMVVVPDGMTIAKLLGLPLSELHFKLIDFGIARLFKQGQSSDTVVIGTPGYAAPEQYGQGQTSTVSDIYSLGATMHHLLTNVAPNTLPLPSLESIAPNLNPRLIEMVNRATEFEPASRYASADAMQLDLQALLPKPSFQQQSNSANSSNVQPSQVNVPQAPAQLPTPPAAGSQAPLFMAVTGIVVAAVAGAIALGQLSGRPSETPTTPTAQVTPVGNSEWLHTEAPGLVAFGLRGADGYKVHVSDLDGGAPQPLKVNGGSIAPAWSPDGRQMALTRITGDRQSIVIGEADGDIQQQISPADQNARYPAWSPNSRQIAFALQSGGGWKLAIHDLDTGELLLPGPERVAWISWVNGLLLYAAPPQAGMAQDVYTLDVSGTPRNLSNTPDFEEDFPTRSPDGKRIAFVGSPSGTANLAQRQIFVMDADGTNRVQLTQGAGPHTNPVWSPDGAWIAYLSKAAGGDWQVWVMRADGSEPRQISFEPEPKFYLAWGP